MVYLFLADGFEIIEAMSPYDMLKRANIDVKTVGVTGEFVEASCGICVKSDISIEDFNCENMDAIILPGGMPGTTNLESNDKVQLIIDKAVNEQKLVCAICAAPSILGNKGLLKGKEAIAYPGFESALDGAVISENYVVSDGNFITAKGAGVSVDFGLEIVRKLAGKELSDKIRNQIQCQ